MRRILQPFLSFLLCFSVGFSAYCQQQGIKCDSCGKAIRGGQKYVRIENRNLCEKCYEKTLPACAVCGKKLAEGYLKSKDGRLFCSEKCISTTWPKCHHCHKAAKSGAIVTCEKGELFFCETCAAMPKCFSCSMPGDCKKLDDGRPICPECLKTAVMDRKKGEELVAKVRAVMSEKLGLKTGHKIAVEFVDTKKLDEISPQNQVGLELGLFMFQESVEKITETRTNVFGKVTEKTVKENVEKDYRIYFLYGMPERKFMEVAAHELGHDWMQEHHPGVAELRIKEGWAEYVASKVNALLGNASMNTRMEKNPDPTYGEGYRMIGKIAASSGDWLAALRKYFRENSQGERP